MPIGEREDGDECEPGRLAQRAQRVADVLPKAFERRERPHVARLLLQVRHVAEPASRFVARGVGAQPVRPVIRLAHREMKRQLVVQIAIEPSTADDGDEPMPERATEITGLTGSHRDTE